MGELMIKRKKQLKIQEKQREKRRETLRIKKTCKEDIFLRLLGKLYELDGTIKKIEEYLKKNRNINEWIICSDYCHGDKNKKNYVSTFSLIPLDKSANEIKNEIVLKKDFKNIGKEIPEEYIVFLKEMNTFTFNFIYNEKVLKNIVLDIEEERKAMKNQINVLNVEEKFHQLKENYLDDLKKFQTKLDKNNFSNKLYKNILLNITYLLFIELLLKNNIKKLDKVLWISDRDKLTEFSDYFILVARRIINLKIKNMYPEIKATDFGFIKISSDNNQEFDCFIRIPDYFCGVLASIDIKKGKTKVELPDKYGQIISNVLVSNEKISNVVLFSRDEKIGAGSICFNR